MLQYHDHHVPSSKLSSSACVYEILTFPFSLNIPLTTARVCDNELLRCQNGGECVNNRCSCPYSHTGLLCEKPRCESELGGCKGANSGQRPLKPPSLYSLLTLLLLGVAMLRETPCWSTML
ncbi:hypothetical protein CHARACLAT_021307 [Characodon lateralis]|uniref:EGF-like domain-containing protein n=1 Tax=Characodon lateralis TaxID=208331 RepID=A0ABU7D3M9_9TELE|nr:hypothetical protein [Characodon lateralis]